MFRLFNPYLVLWLCFCAAPPSLALTGADAATRNASAGWAAYEDGRFEDAKALMSSAVRMRPNDADFQAALGVIELKTGDQAGAIQHLKAAIRLKPSDAEYRLRLAAIYQVSNNDLGALQLLQGTAVIPKLRGTWHFTRGFSLFRIGRFERARKEFEPLVGDPQFTAPANFFLGNIAFSENRFQDAARYYQRAIRSGNSEANIAYNAYTYNYGLALFQLGKYREAEEQFKSSVARYDRDPLPWMFLGRCEQERGNYKSAIDMLEKSIQVDPSFGLAYYELARLQKRYGDPARAAELFNTIGLIKQEEIAAEERRAARLRIGDAQP